ncbi:MAG: FKBP-type peptidyl-prolyl cis-trans isomerase [Bacteroidales bacterium]|nr:FKBP-type peptidyl-prolyl cis-trans isomerase [Bacteroidales bacterium]
MKPLLFLIPLALLISCSCNDQKDKLPYTKRVSKEVKADLNHWWVRNDSALIVHYSDSLGLDSIPDERGLWLTIHKEGDDKAKSVNENSVVTISYVISDFVTGKKFYTSKKLGPKKINIAHTDEPQGLLEALVGLRDGTKATAVLLPDKAFGLVGDGEKIEGRRIIRYDFEILKVEN